MEEYLETMKTDTDKMKIKLFWAAPVLRMLIMITSMAAALPCSAQVSFGESSLFNGGWLFMKEDIENGQDKSMDDSAWEEVNLPHDWSVKGPYSPTYASCTGFLPAGIGWYRKHFDGNGINGAKAFIYFEGVYNRSSVYLNGHLLGERPSGYASFMYDMTPYLDRHGENVIAVRADHSRIADSRWYTGSGIYRNVWLVQSGETHFSQWGISYEAVKISESSATVNVDVNIDGPVKGRLSVSILDAEGKAVSGKMSAAGASQKISLKIKKPHLWSTDDPYLYTLRATLADGKDTLDRACVTMGLRSLEFNADKGFALNGRDMKVKGVCLHHDAGSLGAVVPEEFLETRLRTLKSIGTNAIRTSHNPQSPLFYDLCDRLGLLVMDEAFDEWEFNKKKWVEGWNVGTPAMDGTADFFEEWCERDIKDMVRRDRNHPCVFLWSIGNEVDYPNDPYSHPILDGDGIDFTQPLSGGYRPDAPDASRIGKIAEKLAGYVRSTDSSRPVTGALAGVVMSNMTSYPEAVDVVGYNYTESRYLKDHKAYPDRIIYGSENSSTYGAWKAVRDNDFIFGQFIWTGADYLGESNEWPSRGFYSGLLDLANNVKPRGYFKASMWMDEPMCYIGTYPKPSLAGAPDSFDAWDSWNYEDGQMIRVVCYTNVAKARLLLNGKVVGGMTEHNDDSGIIGWDVPYSAGELLAEGFDAEDNKVSEYAIRTSLRPYAIKAVPDKEKYHDGSTAQIKVEVVDDNGNPVRLADNSIVCTIEGPAALLGMEAGDNTDMGDYTDNVQRAYRGRLTVYVKIGEESGDITVRLASPLLKGTSVKLLR